MELSRQLLVDMEVINQKLKKLAGWEYAWLCLLLLVTLVIHFSIVNHPDEPLFDEKYYVNDARSILNGEGNFRSEHPSLGELMITFGISLFGDNPLGWRFFSILFGTVGLFLFYLICRQLTLSRKASFLAMFLLALEDLTFIQASVAMIDVYSVTFMLASFYFYLRGNYPLAGVSLCFSALSKLNGALSFLAILGHWLLARRDRPVHFSASMALAPVLFFQLLPLFDFIITGRLIDPVSRMLNMLRMTASLTFSYAYQAQASRPWEWIIYPQIVPYWWEPNYVAAISFTVWAFIIPGMCYMAFLAKKGNQAALFSIMWFAGTYLVWIPLNIATDRVTFVYYFYPTVGAICIGLGLGLSRLIDFWDKNRGKLGWSLMLMTSGYLLIHVAIFFILSPLLTPWVPLYRYISPP